MYLCFGMFLRRKFVGILPRLMPEISAETALNFCIHNFIIPIRVGAFAPAHNAAGNRTQFYAEAFTQKLRILLLRKHDMLLFVYAQNREPISFIGKNTFCEVAVCIHAPRMTSQRCAARQQDAS